MMDAFNIISQYKTFRRNGWKGLIHRDFEPARLLSLIDPASADMSKTDRKKIGSSDNAEVYRLEMAVGGHPVALYVKEYFSRSVTDRLKHILRPSRATRSFSAGIMLEANGLHSPDLVGVLEKGQRNVLITLEIPNARPLYAFFGGERPVENDTALHDRRRMITELGETIGRMHANGIFHGDLRGGNLLISEGSAGRRYYFIDNERTVQYRRIPSRRRIKNLVQLNLLQAITLADRMRFFKAYAAAAGLDKTASKSIALRVIEVTQKRTERRARGRIGITGDMQHHWNFERTRQGGHRGTFDTEFCRRPGTTAFIEQIESLMETGHVLKDDRATRVVRCTWNGWDIVIKRYNHQGLWHSLRHTIKGSRAKKCWRFGHRLVEHGIATARPLGYLEHRPCGLIRQSYIINQYIEGPQLYAVMNLPGHSQAEQKAVMEQAEQLLEKMGRHRLTHADMKPANLLICKGKPVLIDLDSMERHRIGCYFTYRYNKMVNYFHDRLHGKKK